jgi:hypothetical protein
MYRGVDTSSSTKVESYQMKKFMLDVWRHGHPNSFILGARVNLSLYAGDASNSSFFGNKGPVDSTSDQESTSASA